MFSYIASKSVAKFTSNLVRVWIEPVNVESKDEVVWLVKQVSTQSLPRWTITDILHVFRWMKRRGFLARLLEVAFDIWSGNEKGNP